MMIPKQLRKILSYKLILLTSDTLFSLYTATAVSDLLGKAAAGVSESLWSSVLRLAVIAVCYLTLKGFFGCFAKKREAFSKQELRFSLYRAFFSIPPADIYALEDTGEILESFRDDFNNYTQLWCDVIPSMIMSAVSYIVYLLYAGLRKWKICVVMFILSQLQIIVPLVIEPHFYDNYAEDRECEAKATNAEIEAHTAFMDIRIFGLKKWYTDYLAKFQNGAANAGKKYEYLCGVGTSLETLVNSVITYGTYALIGLFVFSNRLSVENAALLIYLSGMIYSALLETYQKITDLAENRMAAERLKKLTSQSSAETHENLRHADSIRIKNLTVRADDKTILDLPDFSVAPDAPIVITGANGSGKSTLLKVLAGMILPDSGEISASGSGSGVFLVPQKDMKLKETAMELVTENETESFRKYADTLDLRPELLERPIDTLSDGERKKIYLALAFSQEDKYLLLDEPTNHLDSHAKDTLAAIAADRRKKILIVTHDAYFLEILRRGAENLRVTELNRKEGAADA